MLQGNRFPGCLSPPHESWGLVSAYTGYKHQLDLGSMVQTASSGCEICSFFLKCAEEWPHHSLDEVQGGVSLALTGI